MGNVLFGQLQLAATFAYELINPVTLMPAHVEIVIAVVMLLLVVMWALAKYELASTTVMCGLVFICILGCFYIHVKNNSRSAKFGINLRHPTSILKNISPTSIKKAATKKMTTTNRIVHKHLKANTVYFKNKVKNAKANLQNHKNIGNILKSNKTSRKKPVTKTKLANHEKKKQKLKEDVTKAKKEHVAHKQVHTDHKRKSKAEYAKKKAEKTNTKNKKDEKEDVVEEKEKEEVEEKVDAEDESKEELEANEDAAEPDAKEGEGEGEENKAAE